MEVAMPKLTDAIGYKQFIKLFEDALAEKKEVQGESV